MNFFSTSTVFLVIGSFVIYLEVKLGFSRFPRVHESVGVPMAGCYFMFLLHLFFISDSIILPLLDYLY